MPVLRSLRPDPILLIAVAMVSSLVGWAFPEELTSWRSVAIVTGWIGCGLLLTSLLLMVREPWLAAKLGGLEPMYRWHHRFGVWAYLFLLLHRWRWRPMRGMSLPRWPGLPWRPGRKASRCGWAGDRC